MASQHTVTYRVASSARRLLPPVLAVVVLTVAVGGVVYQAFGAGFGSSGDVPAFILITLSALSLASLYFITASGFTLIFGLMRITNLAHGSLFLLGGYVALHAVASGLTWWLGVVLAMVGCGAVGLVMHQLFLRWNQGQDLRQALITIAVGIIVNDQLLAYFGAAPETIPPPPLLAESLDLGVYQLSYPMFRVFLIGAAGAVGLLFWLAIKWTRLGMVVRAGVDDTAMASALGINTKLVFAGAFMVGAALAGLGGAFAGTALSLAPGQDQAFLVSSLVVVIIGGMGSLGGAAVGALLLGLVDQYASAYLPAGYSNLSILLTFVLLAVVLAVKPTGLFGRAR
ncbi:MAG TPA: branched-chain amino acid ABC transporter permease [Jiangellales bacterium]|nr:branched-chain amino acid ABC transporter permease [Jiangellales bacterium]